MIWIGLIVGCTTVASLLMKSNNIVLAILRGILMIVALLSSAGAANFICGL